MPREITSHRVNGLNEALSITVLDEPGSGGACHEYEIKAWNGEQNVHYVHFQFQNGPINVAGPNGISNEALLAIVRDRLEGFQSGMFACDDNAKALAAVDEAITWLHKRTKERTERGVEGTNEK